MCQLVFSLIIFVSAFDSPIELYPGSYTVVTWEHVAKPPIFTAAEGYTCEIEFDFEARKFPISLTSRESASPQWTSQTDDGKQLRFQVVEGKCQMHRNGLRCQVWKDGIGGILIHNSSGETPTDHEHYPHDDGDL